MLLRTPLWGYMMIIQTIYLESHALRWHTLEFHFKRSLSHRLIVHNLRVEQTLIESNLRLHVIIGNEIQDELPGLSSYGPHDGVPSIYSRESLHHTRRDKGRERKRGVRTGSKFTHNFLNFKYKKCKV